MQKRILAVFAHPDDETFGPGGAIAKYAHEGVEVHILCATRGEAGLWDKKAEKTQKGSGVVRIEHLRENELLNSAKRLGVKRVEFLDFIDGTLCNSIYHELAEKIINKINTFKPQVVVTLDRLGVSGHLDHIAVSMITTYAFLKTTIPQKLYYLCLPIEWADKRMRNYFIYYPEGYDKKRITTRIDYTPYWEIRRKAMEEHKTQWKDVVELNSRYAKWPKIDHFILGEYRNVTVSLPESDFFSGIED